MREAAEEEAIRVFAQQSARSAAGRAGGRPAHLGLDPGLRTGVKVAVVDATGKLVDTATPSIPMSRAKHDGTRRLHALAEAVPPASCGS
jgi:uncharacterized protein